MTDKEKFQRVFGKLHASPDVLTEVLNMTTDEKVIPIKKKHFTPKVAAAIAAVILVVGSGSAAYAMDLGGIQRIVQVWIHGDQTDATFTVENGNYTLDYKDADGNDVHQGGGGVAIEDGICYVQLKAGGKTQYITVKYQDGFATSPHGYVQPSEFN